MAKQTTAELLADLSKVVEDLRTKVDSLLLPKEVAPVAPVRQLEVPSNTDELDLMLGGKSDPVSSDIRQLVDEVLNKNFGIHLLSQLGSFKFSIVVPDKYSSLSEDKKKMIKFDVRPKVIENAEGLNGARAWCELVLNNFDQTMQSLIVSDRIADK